MHLPKSIEENFGKSRDVQFWQRTQSLFVILKNSRKKYEIKVLWKIKCYSLFYIYASDKFIRRFF